MNPIDVIHHVLWREGRPNARELTNEILAALVEHGEIRWAPHDGGIVFFQNPPYGLETRRYLVLPMPEEPNDA